VTIQGFVEIGVQRQQAEQRGGSGDHARAGIAGLSHQGVEAQPRQQGEEEEDTRHAAA
jgi:hypothetical protein